MKLKRERGLNSEVFTGAMADVSFLLIIFFMITFAFSAAKGMDLTMGHETEGPFEAQDAIDVFVLKDGSFKVDGRSMPLDGLLPYIASKLEKNPNKPVILRGEKKTPYGAMIRMLDNMRLSDEEYGFEIKNLAIPTFREQDIFFYNSAND